MIKYYATAMALKAFSLTPAARNTYHRVSKLRQKHLAKTEIGKKYFFRTTLFLELLRKHGVLRDGLNVFELGTGWVHWEALMLRNEIACTAMLYDVVDNRDQARLVRILHALTDPAIRRRLDITNDDLIPVLDSVSADEPIESIYEKLGFSYHVDPSGLLKGVPDLHYDLVVSSDVFEHLYRPDIPEILSRLTAIMKPGSFALHQIVLNDHLRYYAKNTHPKQYLAYADDHWEKYLSNKVQYINRVQLPEWRTRFEASGVHLIEERSLGKCDPTTLRVDRAYAGIPKEDLACTVVQFLVQKPAQPGG